MKKLAIRVDFGGIVGLGHLNRCLYLAQFLKKNNYDILFILKKFQKIDKHLINSFKKIYINKNLFGKKETLILNKILKKNKIHNLLIDCDHKINKANIKNYQNFFKNLNKKTHIIKWDELIKINTKIDTLYSPYNNFLKSNKNYRYKINGFKFFILPEEFFFKRVLKKKIKNILINFGATNKNLEIKMAVSLIIKNFKNIKIYIMTQKINFKKIKIAFPKYNQLIFNSNPKEISNYIRESDIAIVSSGLGKFECLTNGLPLIVHENNSNNFIFNKYLIKHDMIIFSKNKNEFEKNLIKLKLFKIRKKMSLNCLKYFNKNNKKFLLNRFNKYLN
jgi:spore coat polysaccharide biosynthesis predicted glycosyltransferase SpsG